MSDEHADGDPQESVASPHSRQIPPPDSDTSHVPDQAQDAPNIGEGPEGPIVPHSPDLDDQGQTPGPPGQVATSDATKSPKNDPQRVPVARTAKITPKGTKSSSNWDWLATSFGADLKALALMRIAVSLILLLDLLSRWADLALMFSDSGAFPRSLLIAHSPWNNLPSVYLFCGTNTSTYLVFSIHILATVALLVGYRTRVASFICFVLLTSLQVRNPWAVLAADQLVRLAVVHGIFLPWAEVWSLDAKVQSRNSASAAKLVSTGARVLTPVVASWRLQLALVYVFSGLNKVGPMWGNGTAVEVALQADGYSCEMGLRFVHWALQQDGLLPFITHAIGPIEVLLGLLLIAPWKRLQSLGFIGVTLMHLVFNLTLSLGFFGLHMVAATLCVVSFDRRSTTDPEKRSDAPDSSPPRDWSWRRQPGEGLLSLICVGAALICNLPSQFKSLSPTLHPLKAIVSQLGLQQGWTMFSPPPDEGGYAAVLARTAQNRWVNLLAPQPTECETRLEAGLWDKTVAQYYKNRQRHLYFDRWTREGKSPRDVWRAIVVGTVRQWEREHPDWHQRIVEVELVRYHRKYEAGQGYSPMVEKVLQRQTFD